MPQPKLRAGDLDKRVWIDELINSQDASGANVEEWRPLQEVWASIEPLRGREQIAAASVVAEFDTRIRIRWSPNFDMLTAKWRIRQPFRGTEILYDIKSVPPVPTQDGVLEIMAASGLTEG